MSGHYGSESAEQTVRIIFQGVEIGLKLSGSGVKNLAEFIYTATKNEKNLNTRSGEVRRVRELLKENKPLQTYKLHLDDLKRFRKLSKQHGLLYTVVKDSRSADGLCTVILKEEEVALLNNVIEEMGLRKVAPEKDNDFASKKNEHQSKNNYRHSERDSKPSVKKKLAEEKDKLTDKVKNKIKERIR